MYCLAGLRGHFSSRKFYRLWQWRRVVFNAFTATACKNEAKVVVNEVIRVHGWRFTSTEIWRKRFQKKRKEKKKKKKKKAVLKEDIYIYVLGQVFISREKQRGKKVSKVDMSSCVHFHLNVNGKVWEKDSRSKVPFCQKVCLYIAMSTNTWPRTYTLF